nr:hypothetical protein [Tanacetum cinerariifolium]
MKKYDYGHLEEIEVRLDNQELYTFKEGDFKRLRLQDIEDMLLLLVQQKLTNLTIDEQYDLNVELRIRRIIAVTRLKIMKKYDYGHLEEIEVRRDNQELYTFKEGIRMEYLPMRKWSSLDKKRARVMVHKIDKQLYQRRLMWNLEKFVGGRIY